MIDSSERALFTESVRHVYDDATPADARLAQIGWRDALADWGGTAVEVVLVEQGRACGRSSAVDDVVADALGLPDDIAVVLPGLGSTHAPGTISPAGLTVAGVGTGRVLDAAHVVVVAVDTEDTHRAVVVPADALATSTLGGIDAEAGLVTVTAEAVASSTWTDTLAADWAAARAAAQVALACELVGLGRGMLELARDHAMARVQFGKSIASFQAVRHRLVDAYLAIEAGHAAVTACTDVIGTDEGLSAVHAAIAKALSGRGARTAARHCQQVLAGIGFTAEHDFHHYLRRALLLDELLGSAKVLTREVGSIAVAERTVPFALPL